jgi:hypothetical protein
MDIFHDALIENDKLIPQKGFFTFDNLCNIRTSTKLVKNQSGKTTGITIHVSIKTSSNDKQERSIQAPGDIAKLIESRIPARITYPGFPVDDSPDMSFYNSSVDAVKQIISDPSFLSSITEIVDIIVNTIQTEQSLVPLYNPSQLEYIKVIFFGYSPALRSRLEQSVAHTLYQFFKQTCLYPLKSYAQRALSGALITKTVDIKPIFLTFHGEQPFHDTYSQSLNIPIVLNDNVNTRVIQKIPRWVYETIGNKKLLTPYRGFAEENREKLLNPFVDSLELALVPIDNDSKPLPEGWYAAVDPASGKTYYGNNITKHTQWERPALRAALETYTLSYQGKVILTSSTIEADLFDIEVFYRNFFNIVSQGGKRKSKRKIRAKKNIRKTLNKK